MFDSMIKRVLAAAVMGVAAGLVVAPAMAVPVIDPGTFQLLPDKPGQTIALSVSGGNAVEGLSFYLQVADGGVDAGGVTNGPAIRNVDLLTGTIFAGNNIGAFADAGNTRQVYSAVTLTLGGTVNASGKLATVTLDTTGLAAGTWSLSLGGTVAGDTDFAGVAATTLVGTITIPGGTSVWTRDGNGTLSDAANWAGGNVPAGVTSVARFGPDISAARTVSLAGAVTLGRMEFDSAFAYQIDSPAGAVLTLDGGVSPAVVDVQQGAHVISAPLAAPRGLAKVGSGSLTLSGAVSVAGDVVVSGGQLVVGSPLRPVTGSLVVTGPGAVSLAAPAVSKTAAGYTVAGEFGSIAVSAGGQATVPMVDRGVSKASVVVTSGLNLAGGTLDMGNSDLVIRGGAGNVAQIRSWLASGNLRASGATAGAAGYVPFTTMAVFVNDAGDGVNGYFGSYDGVGGLGANDVIVKYTYLGDTNLDGVLDGRDYKRVFEGLMTGQSGWAWGDADNSGGPVTVADVQLFLQAYAAYQGSGLSLGDGADVGGAVASVPEPGLAVVMAGVPLAVRRRRRVR
jgi:hypothetical protein